MEGMIQHPLDVYSDAEFKQLTGSDKDIFRYIYTTYCGDDTVINKTYKLYQLLNFYRHYPTARAFISLYGASAKAYGRYLSKIYLYEEHLSSVIDEIHHAWTNRLQSHNHLPHQFSSNVTGCLDTFPVYVVRPLNSHWQRCMYNGKYGGHVAKVQVICDHRGSVIWWSGPHIGTMHDLRLYREYPPPLLPNEQILADKAYVGGGPHLIAPFKKKRGRISHEKRAFNKVHRWYRSTVEHSIGFIKRFRILNGMYRGRLSQSQIHLERALKIIIHLCSYDNQQNPHRTHVPLCYSDDDMTESDEGDSMSDRDNMSDSDNMNDTDNMNDSDEEKKEETEEVEFDEQSFNPSIGTGKVITDFRVYDIVWLYWMGDWLQGKVTKVRSRKGRLDVRLNCYNYDLVDLLPKHVRPA